MNKASIVDAVHAKIGGTKVHAKQAVEIVVDSIVSSLSKGDTVSIGGLGIFNVSLRKSRAARNPQTHEMVQVPAMKVAKFSPCIALKKAVRKLP